MFEHDRTEKICVLDVGRADRCKTASHMDSSLVSSRRILRKGIAQDCGLLRQGTVRPGALDPRVQRLLESWTFHCGGVHVQACIRKADRECRRCHGELPTPRQREPTPDPALHTFH